MRHSVTTEINQPRQVVFEHLADLANHEAYMDHVLTDWRFLSEDTTGVGAHLRVRARGLGDLDITVVECTPDRIEERTLTGKDFSKRARGYYTLRDAAGGGTEVTFTMEPEITGLADRVLATVSGPIVKRGNAKGMARLKAILEKEGE